MGTSLVRWIWLTWQLPSTVLSALHQRGVNINIHDYRDLIHQQSIEHSSAAELQSGTWFTTFSTFISAEIKPLTSQKFPQKQTKHNYIFMHDLIWVMVIWLKVQTFAFALERKDTITEWCDNLAQVFYKACPSHSCAIQHHFHLHTTAYGCKWWWCFYAWRRKIMLRREKKSWRWINWASCNEVPLLPSHDATTGRFQLKHATGQSKPVQMKR